ncbi:protein FAM47E [Saccopteryx leptura]|uniref:protein FAM47E n=1 Tax=Saccopteryx leptura TaxID=249018 RepID=UPI00339C6854
MEKRRLRPRFTERRGVGRNCRPSYGENLPPECGTEPKDSPPVHTFMNTKRWVFVRKGLDDFRYGCPSCEGMITRGLQEHPVPLIYPRAPRPPPTGRQNRLPKLTALFSKLSPAQQARRAFVADIEAKLMSQPLYQYPNLEEDLPAEVSLKVLEVLDPDRKLEDTRAHCEGVKKTTKDPGKRFKNCSSQVNLGQYCWKPTGLDSGSFCKSLVNPLHETDLVQEGDLCQNENVCKAVDDFSTWADNIGSLKIDKEFIFKKFKLEVENPRSYTNSTISDKQVSPGKKNNVGLYTPVEREFFQKSQNPSKPELVKMRCRARCMNPKPWKKQKAGEPLIDSKISHKDANLKRELQKEELRWSAASGARTEDLSMSTRKLKLKEGDGTPQSEVRTEELFARLHGPVAFKEFILRKGYRMPRLAPSPTPTRSRAAWNPPTPTQSRAVPLEDDDDNNNVFLRRYKSRR